MKKIFLTLIVLLLFVVGASADEYASEYGVKFGMTPGEVLAIEAENGNQSTGDYNDKSSYQLYYKTDVHFYTLTCKRMQYDFDKENRLLFQIEYVTKGGAADFAFVKTELTAKYGDPLADPDDTGEYSLLYNQNGRSPEHIDAAHWMVPELDLGLDLWYNDYDTVFIVFYQISNQASYGTDLQYIDDITGISFAYMNDWIALPYASEPLKIAFTHRTESRSTIQYMQLDLWSQIESYYKSAGYTRDTVGVELLDDAMIAALMQPYPVSNIRTVTYNGVQFRLFDYTITDETANVTYSCTAAITLKYGYIDMLQLTSMQKHDELLPDFEKLLTTVVYTR